jgi:hypothetical protein
MTEHLHETTIELYRERRLDAEARVQTDAHLTGCPSCVSRLLNREHSALAFDSLSEALLPAGDEAPFHLSRVELESHIAGLANKADRIILESHIETCGDCRNELQRLTLASTAGTQPARSFNRPWRLWNSFTPARVAAAIALVSLLALLLLLWPQKRGRDETAGNKPPEAPAATPSTSAAAPANPPALPLEPLVSLKDNSRAIYLDRDGRLSGLENFDGASQDMAKAILSGGRLEKPRALQGLVSPPLQLLGDSPGETTFALRSPVGKVIIDEQPTLRWQALPGASTYVASVFDGDFKLVAQSPPITKTEWALSTPLARGGLFYWEITATKEGKEISAPAAPQPRVQFKVLDAETFNTLRKLKGQQPASHLVLGLTYVRGGLLSEARNEFKLLRKENPDSAEVRRLLQTVRQWQAH